MVMPEPLPDSDIRVPDVVGEVTAWRAWMLVGTKKLPRLMSVSHGANVESIWPPGRWFRAVCAHGCEIPGETHSCGIYAARSRDHLLELGYGNYGESDNRVVGEIAYAGKVIPGSQGYRGELARVKRLIVPYELWEWCEPLASAYRVPTEVGFLFSATDRRV